MRRRRIKERAALRKLRRRLRKAGDFAINPAMAVSPLEVTLPDLL